MKAVNHKTDLEAKIIILKAKQANEFDALKQQYNDTVASITPFNIIKSVANEIISAPDLKSNLVNGTIGFVANYLSKNLMNVNSANPVKRVLGKVLKFAMKNIVAQ